MISIIKMAGTGGHGNMITGLKLNYYTLRTLPKESKLRYKIIIKTFDDKYDPELRFYRLANMLGRPDLDDKINDVVFQELLKWMPEYHGVFDIDSLKGELDEASYAKVKEMKEVPEAFLIIEDITFRDGYHIDLKMGTRRFDSSAIANHLLDCQEHKDKGKTKLQTQTDKRDKSVMISKYGVNIVAGKAKASSECINKSDDKQCIMGDQKSKDLSSEEQENSYEKVKRSLLDIFLPRPRPKDKINLINILKLQLKRIKIMFEEVLSKHGLHFFSSSLFITLDKNRTSMKIKMIDFAHVEAYGEYEDENGNDYFTGLPTFMKEMDANKECLGKTPTLLKNEDWELDKGYIKGLNTLLDMISDKEAELKTKKSRDGYKIKF